jgi:hypothetical protein
MQPGCALTIQEWVYAALRCRNGLTLHYDSGVGFRLDNSGMVYCLHNSGMALRLHYNSGLSFHLDDSGMGLRLHYDSGMGLRLALMPRSPTPHNCNQYDQTVLFDMSYRNFGP